ncbi:hypothetical protein [Bacillus sp. 1P06AnD]|uniref:hypothetical protein n=1 Tax=Bacillus sp. 1P06AnD TaxID=3132208 RepID=UPI0039A3068B
MKWMMDHYDLLYILLIGVLLVLSWSFYKQSQYDERRKSRFSRRGIQRTVQEYKGKFYNEKHEVFLRKNGMPKWITSVRLNFFRFALLFFLLVIACLQLVTSDRYVSYFDLAIWATIPIILTPKHPYPLSFIVQQVNRKRKNDVSNETYQLYNEIKASFQAEDEGASNSYYIIQRVLPYYNKIRPTLEKMMPYLEKKQLTEAWELFSKDLDTHDAQMLSVVMREVESLKKEQAFLLLEQKRQEFSNALYNRHTEYLSRRKTMIFGLVVIGALSVFFNELTVFFMWYQEVMSTVNGMN